MVVMAVQDEQQAQVVLLDQYRSYWRQFHATRSQLRRCEFSGAWPKNDIRRIALFVESAVLI